jgi:MFS family permease
LGFEWIKRVDWKKVILSALIFTVIAFIVRQIEAILTMKYYTLPAYFGVWSKLMMPEAGPPPLSFMMTSFVFIFATGLSLALVYVYLREFLPKEERRRMLTFTDLLVGLSIVLFTLPVYLLFNVPVQLLLSWFISFFVIIFAGSYVFVKVIK